MTTMMHDHLSALLDHLSALLDAGHEVTLEKAEDGYAAHVVREADGESWYAIGSTPGLAVWTASPLHGDAEPYPGEALEALIAGVGRHGYKAGHRDGYQARAGDRVKALEGNFLLLADAVARQDEHLQALLAAFETAFRYAGAKEGPVIDSHVWYCATCGGECIGTEPEDHVCRGCGGT